MAYLGCCRRAGPCRLELLCERSLPSSHELACIGAPMVPQYGRREPSSTRECQIDVARFLVCSYETAFSRTASPGWGTCSALHNWIIRFSQMIVYACKVLGWVLLRPLCFYLAQSSPSPRPGVDTSRPRTGSLQCFGSCKSSGRVTSSVERVSA